MPIDLVSATDLEQWAERRDAQSQLPQLVRRLIAATADGLTRLAFRSGEGVALPGWDGIAEAVQASTFVPAGISGWEMGVGAPGPKANEDYRTRTNDPGELNPARSTFVFVTPKRWPRKSAWANERRAEGVWAEVIAYDADDLETWLESAQAVHIWISALLGKDPHDAESLETWWDVWSSATRPPLPPALVLSGREREVEQLQTTLRGEPATITVVADSRSEAIAFLAAAMLTQDDTSLIQRALVVRAAQVWRRLATSRLPLVLAPIYDEPAVAMAVDAGHHVILPFGRDVPTSRGIHLPRLRRSGIEAALDAAGLSRDRASTLATLGRRSLLSLRRTLALNPDAEIPQWADPENADEVVPAVLAGAWNDASEGDQEAVATIAGRPYQDVTRALTRWANAPDPPVRRVGDVWLVSAKADAWSLTAHALTSADLDRFREIARRVLGEDDPALELPHEERAVAAMLGRRPRYSGHLARAIADTLALMATTANDVALAGGRRGDDEAQAVVRTVLEGANADPSGRRWQSLAAELPLLAEAAPTRMLDAIEAGSRTVDGPVLRLFQDGRQNELWSGSPHSHLLWALETLAWSPEYLPHAALRLASLARFDPGGRTLNRPLKSLRDVMLFWRPGTAASLDQRLEVIDLLRGRESEIAWQLMLALVPGHRESASRTSSPHHRDWRPDIVGAVTLSDLIRASDAVAERCIEDAGLNGDRWAALLERAAPTGLPAGEKVTAAIEQMDPAALTPAGRVQLYRTVRDLVNKHGRFLDADWAMPRAILDRLIALIPLFEPESATARHGWLFEQRALDSFIVEDREERRRSLSEAQEAALSEIIAEVGLNGVFDWAATLGDERLTALQIGEALARTNVDSAPVLMRVGAGRESDRRVGTQYVAAMARSRGLSWAEDALSRFGIEWPPEHKALFLRSLPACSRVWNTVERLGPETSRLYWENIPAFALPTRGDEARVAAERLVGARRARAALDVLAMIAHDAPEQVPNELLASALEQAITDNSDPIEGSLAQYISEHLDRLDDAAFDPARLAQLEWAYLPLFRYDRRRSRVLHRALAQEPAFFLQVVSLVYRADQEEPRDLSDSELALARSAGALLDSWRTLPGSSPDGTLDASALFAWTREARRLLNEARRAEVGDMAIGRVLRYGPPFGTIRPDAGRPEGTERDAGVPETEWPAEAIRDLIESIASDDLERGLELEVYNSRGATTRGLTEGGRQERALAERYRRYAAVTRIRWPRTTNMLTRIAEGYEADAERHDRDAELTEDNWR